MEQMNKVQAIKRFFEAQPYGRKVEMLEMKALTIEDRSELGTLAAEAMGVEIVASTV